MGGKDGKKPDALLSIDGLLEGVNSTALVVNRTEPLVQKIFESLSCCKPSDNHFRGFLQGCSPSSVLQSLVATRELTKVEGTPSSSLVG